MEEVKVCRICLTMGVKLFDIQTFPLGVYLEPIIGINPLSSMDLPPYACFMCAHLLKKYYYFRERCLLGQSILYGMLQTTGKITCEEISQLDSLQLNLRSPLSQKVLEGTEVIIHGDNEENGHANHSFSNQSSVSGMIREIKCEYESVQDQPLLTISHPVKLEDNVVENQDDLGEGQDDFLGDQNDLQPSSDDEPLSLHRTLKKEKKKTKKGRKKRAEISFDGVQTAELTPEIQTLLINPVKRKRGRPRKQPAVGKDSTSEIKVKKERRTTNTGGVVNDDFDLEEFVTVVELSLEDQIREVSSRQHLPNYRNAPFQCSLCYKGFVDTDAWKHHTQKHDPSAGDIECPVCKFRFKTKRALQKHAANHEKKYVCKSCPYVSKTTTQAKQHQRWHKGVTYKCQYCDEVSTKWTSYLSHVRMKHPSEFICGICGYSFVSQLGLSMHKTMMHKDLVDKLDATQDGPYCAQCEVQFVSQESYKRHMVTSTKHQRSKDFTTGCRQCGESFATAEELRLHHRREHARQRPKNYGKKPTNGRWPASCEHCGEEIPNAREYWTHFRRVHPDKNYPIEKNHICDICGKSFRGNAFLVYHKRTHFEERAYKCAQCPKSFFNRTNLQMHEKTHSETRPYPCDVCFKAFKCKGALDRHYRSHTGVRPYECELCGKAFAQSNSRKVHMHTVHLKQPAPYVSRARMQRRGIKPKDTNSRLNHVEEPTINRPNDSQEVPIQGFINIY